MRRRHFGGRAVTAGVVSVLLVVGFSGIAAGDPRPAPATAASSPAVQWLRTTGRITVGGRERSYLVVRPTAGNTTASKLPVLVVLHGRNMTPSGTEQMAAFQPVVGPAIYVYPAGYGDSWNAGACCGEAHAVGIDDVGFITAVVRRVLTTQPDASRHEVYLAGYSNGGRMAFLLACAAPTMFAGVAAVEAVPVYSCPRPKPVSLLELVSHDDPLLSVDARQPQTVVNGYHAPNVEDLMAQWRRIGACKGQPIATVVGALSERVWSDCNSGTRLAYALYSGGSHAWPRGDAETPSAERVIWAFFRNRPPTVPAG